jgi:hypothetical protein
VNHRRLDNAISSRKLGKTKVSGPFVCIVAYETKGPDTFVFSETKGPDTFVFDTFVFSREINSTYQKSQTGSIVAVHSVNLFVGIVSEANLQAT